MIIDMSAPERFAHGVRARYVTGCRCEPCRAANRIYNRGRAEALARGESNGLVDVAPVRAHLLKLSAEGCGYKAAADAASVARSVVQRLLNGTKLRVRVQAAKRLLAVDVAAAADGARIDGAATRALVRKLIAAGVTRTRIAQEALGHSAPGLHIGDLVLARTALAVEKFARRELPVVKLMRRDCPLCRYSHAEDREAAEYCAAAIARGVTAHDDLPAGSDDGDRISSERVLQLVPVAGAVSAAEVAERLRVDQPRVATMLSRLCRQGRVRRVALGEYSKPEAA